MLNPLLKELHRLRKLIRDAQGEIDRGPRVMKAHQTNLANKEKAVSDAKDALKHRKADVLTLESTIKSLNQSLAKHEKQLDTLTDPRQIEAKEHDIANTKALVGKTEEDYLTAMTDVDERTTKIPAVEAALAKTKADFKVYETEAAERMARLKEEVKAATAVLAEEEKKIPPATKGIYDRLVKAHGADALAAVDSTSCSHCRVGITQQQMADLRAATEFHTCRNCGRLLYIP
jgi:predicted  nucleic acid-binding Zn-ribbon protein